MYHEIPWSEELINDFINEAKLSLKEAKLLRERALEDFTGKELAKDFKVSERTIYRKIEELKEKYDKISASNPNRFPPRVIKMNYPAFLCEYSGKILFTIDGIEDDIHVIEMENKTFNSSKEMLNHIYSEVCTITNKSLGEIKEIKFLNNISYKVKIKSSN